MCAWYDGVGRDFNVVSLLGVLPWHGAIQVQDKDHVVSWPECVQFMYDTSHRSPGLAHFYAKSMGGISFGSGHLCLSVVTQDGGKSHGQSLPYRCSLFVMQLQDHAMEVCCTGACEGMAVWYIHIQLMACLSTLTNIQCTTLRSTGLPGLKFKLGNSPR